jgi:hypothetical protein
MGYDLHIVRTADWLDSADAPITKTDVETLLASDPELFWSDDYVDMDVDGVTTRFYMIAWNGDSCFWWYKDQIECKNPTPEQQVKLVQISRALGAYAVGDDGEHYQLVSGAGGKTSVVAIEADA